MAWLIGLLMVFVVPSAYLRYPEEGYCDWHSYICQRSSAYAAEFFADLTPGSTVLESRRWHLPPNLLDKDGWEECTFAIVSLPANAPVAASVQTEPRFFGWEWPKSWDDTKKSIAGGLTPIDFLPECYGYWSRTTIETVRSALDDPDSHVLKDFDTLYLYSSEHRIAARVRLGD